MVVQVEDDEPAMVLGTSHMVPMADPRVGFRGAYFFFLLLSSLFFFFLLIFFFLLFVHD